MEQLTSDCKYSSNLLSSLVTCILSLQLIKKEVQTGTRIHQWTKLPPRCLKCYWFNPHNVHKGKVKALKVQILYSVI